MADIVSTLNEGLSDIGSLLGGGSTSSGDGLGYITTDDQGQPVLFRDSHISASVYSYDTNSLSTSPKNKFSYFVRFLKTNNSASGTTSGASSSILGTGSALSQLGGLATTALDLAGDTKTGAEVSLGTNIVSSLLNGKSSNSANLITTQWQQVLGFYATVCERPSMSFRTKTINQYNKKRVVQTGYDLKPITITFNDTCDGAAENMFREYYSFYYGDAANTNSAGWASDMTASAINQGAGGWGFKAPDVTTAEMSYFFDTIQIYIFYNGMFDRYDIVNPKIKAYSSDVLDYSSSTGLLQIKMTFEYEGFVFAEQRQSVLSNKSLIPTWGFSRDSFYNPSYSSVSDTAATFLPKVSFSSPSMDNSYSSSSQLFSLSGLASLATTLTGNSNGLKSYNGIFPAGSTIGNIISQNRGTINQLTGSTTNPTTRALENLAGIL